MSEILTVTETPFDNSSTSRIVPRMLEGVPGDDDTTFSQKLAACLTILALVTQIEVVMISRGLNSTTPAPSIMLVQALAEFTNRALRGMRVFCTIFDGYFCLPYKYANGFWRCGFFAYNEISFALLPDYLTLLMSLDRVFTFSVWYREKWTRTRVWLLMGLIFLTTQLVCLPRAFNQVLMTRPGKRDTCTSGVRVFDQVMVLMGVPAVLLTGALTVKLVLEINNRKKIAKSGAGKRASPVTVALTVNSFTYAVFNFVQYSFIVCAYFAEDMDEKTLYRGISFSSGAAGVTIRGLIYLCMRPMRRAFLRSLGVIGPARSSKSASGLPSQKE